MSEQLNSTSDAQRVEISAIPLPGVVILRTPPEGIFDRHDLQCSQRRITMGPKKGASVQDAHIPADRLEDFIAGEHELLQ